MVRALFFFLLFLFGVEVPHVWLTPEWTFNPSRHHEKKMEEEEKGRTIGLAWGGRGVVVLFGVRWASRYEGRAMRGVRDV